MFVRKHFSICLLAALAVQVFSASANPVETVSNDDFKENAAENDESQLVKRGMFDFVPNPMNMLGSGVKTVDDNLRTARETGIDAAKNTVGSGIQLATGVNPVTVTNLPKEIMKKAVRGARYGTDVAFDATDRTLDGVQNLHDRKKDLLDDYVKPVAPIMVGNAIDTMNDRFDSTIDNIKERVHNGHTSAIETLNNLEERLEKGSPIIPSSITQGIQSAGKMLSPSSWFGGSGVGFSDDASKAAADAAKEMQAPARAAAKTVANTAARTGRAARAAARQALAESAQAAGGRSSWFS